MDALATLNAHTLPFARHMGISYVSASPDKVVAHLTVTAELCTLGKIMHGGALMALADTVGAAGTFLNLPAGATTTTLESKTNFLGGAPLGSVVIAEATPVHRGRRTQVWQTRITSADGRLLALVTQTQLTLATNG